MSKWEYKSVEKRNSYMSIREMNLLGQDGWELVSHAYGSSDMARDQFNVYHFKKKCARSAN